MPDRFGYTLAAVGLLLAIAASARAEGKVDLLIVTEPGVAPTAQMQLMQRLGQAGLGSVRIRAAHDSDEPDLEVRGTESSPRYAVTAVLTTRQDIYVPGTRFQARQISALLKWLDELAKLGPEDTRPEKAAFGLNVDQFEALHRDLAQPVTIETQGKSRESVIRALAGKLQHQVLVDPAMLAAMAGETVAEDLSGMSCGTALAYVASTMNLRLLPQAASDGSLHFAIRPGSADDRAWPVGWEPESKTAAVLPILNETQSINIPGVYLSRVLEVLGERFEVPILLDHAKLFKHEIDPTTVVVDYPAKEAAYSSLLRRVLFQARLKSEIRVDEANQPFVWVTTIKD